MKRQKILVFIASLFFLLGQKGFAQTDTLNKLTSKGKKNGYWKVLLNDKADPVDSLKDSYFYCIELWDNGEDVFNYEKHKWTFSKMTFDGTLPEKRNPKLIEGTFKWFDNKGFLQISETYKNGQPLYIKSYHVLNNKSDTINHVFEDCDFTIKYNNIPGTYYYREHSFVTGTYTEYWFRKGKKGWRVYKIKT